MAFSNFWYLKSSIMPFQFFQAWQKLEVARYARATKYLKCNFMLLLALMVSRVSRNGEIGQNFFINQVLLPPWLCVLVVLMPDFVHHFLSHHHVPRLDLFSLLFAVSNNSQLRLITSGTIAKSVNHLRKFIFASQIEKLDEKLMRKPDISG